MHRINLLLIPLLLAGCMREPAIAQGPAPIARTDSPMFGGTPGRNLVNAIDKNIPTTWSTEEGKRKNVKWVAELGSTSYGGPTIADGVIYMGTDNKHPRDPKIKGSDKAVLMAFRETDGKFLWQIAHDLPNVPTDDGRHQGLCSTPIVEGKRIYYVTPQCEVICATTEGKIEWSYDMSKELKVVPYHLGNCSPLIVGDNVMLVTGNGRNDAGDLPSPKAPSFIAVNKKTGKLVWQSNLPGEKILEGQWSNPTLAMVNGKPQVIFPGGDGVLYSFEPEKGELIWKCNCNPKHVDKRNNYFMGTPVVVGDRLFISLGVAPELGTPTKFSYVVCLDVTKKGDVSPKSYDAKDAANKSSALVWAFGGPIEKAAPGGRKSLFGTTLSTAAVHDGLVYITEETGYLHCLDAKTGQRYWEHDFKSDTWGSPYWADNKVYAVTSDGSVFIFAHGKTCKYYIEGDVKAASKENDRMLPSAELGDSTHSSPVVANGVLYIATRSKLYAFANGK